MSQPTFDVPDSLRPSDFSQAVFMFKGEPYSLEHFPFWIPIFNSPRLSLDTDMAERKIVLKCSRQVAKSVGDAIFALTNALRHKNFNVLLCMPTDKQVINFSKDVLGMISNGTVATNEWYYDRNVSIKQVKNKKYSNNSGVYLANIYISTLSVRGKEAAMGIFDEYQHIPKENAIVVMNSMSRSPFRYFIFSGTPLSSENDLETKWLASTMNEWMVPCRNCGHINGPLGGDGKDKKLKNIGKNGLICERCYSRLFASDGEWIVTNPPQGSGRYEMSETAAGRAAINRILPKPYRIKKPISGEQLHAIFGQIKNIENPKNKRQRHNIDLIKHRIIDLGGYTEYMPVYYDGYHINELMIPPTAPGASSWSEIYRRIKEEPRVLIWNELIGVTFEDNAHPFSGQMISRLCEDYTYVKSVEDIVVPPGCVVFGGLDWAGETAPRKNSNVSLKSYTMLSIAIYDPQTRKIKVDFVKRFYDNDSDVYDNPDSVVDEIVMWCKAYGMTTLAVDYGMGHRENQRLKDILGPENVMEINYVGSTQDYYVYHETTGKWTVGRSKAIELLEDVLKHSSQKGELGYRFATMRGETSEYLSDLTSGIHS